MELPSAPVPSSAKLFPSDMVVKAVEKSSWVLHNEVIRKAVLMERKPS